MARRRSTREVITSLLFLVLPMTLFFAVILWPRESPTQREAVRGLTELLKSDSDRDVRSVSARSLGKIGDPSAVGALFAAYERDEMILRQVVLALQDLGVTPAELERMLRNQRSSRFQQIYTSFWEWLTAIDVRRVALTIAGLVLCFTFFTGLWKYFSQGGSLGEILREKLGTSVLLLCGLAAAYVVILKIPPAQEAKPSARAEIVAIELAKKLKDTTSVDWLCAALLDPQRNVEVRWRAAEALGAIGEARAFEPLSKMLQEKEPKLRTYAAWAIGNVLAKDAKKREDGFEMAALHEAAAEEITELLQLRPNSGALYLLRSQFYGSARQYDKALADLDRARVLAPLSLRAEIHSERGWMYLLLDRPGEALPEFGRAIQFAPKEKVPYFRRALALRELDRQQEALRDLDQVLAFDPRDCDALQQRASLYESLGRWADARADLTAYLRFEPAPLDREEIGARIEALQR